jgi:4-hydroxy-4-methyl-2-oxoglutarate aldolase
MYHLETHSWTPLTFETILPGHVTANIYGGEKTYFSFECWNHLTDAVHYSPEHSWRKITSLLHPRAGQRGSGQEVVIGGEDRPRHRSAKVISGGIVSVEESTTMAKTEIEVSWVNYLKTVDSPTLSNAIELLKVRPHREGFTPLQVRALFPELGRMCGYAVTAQVETVTESGDLDDERFLELYELVRQSPKPAVIAFQEIGGYPDYAAHCGEVMATIFGRVGAIGLVTDCAVRDLPEVRALGFHYFARGSVVSHANFRIVRVGEPVHVYGVVIRSGDLIHGDENGVLLVPDGLEETLPRAIEDVRTRERRLMDWVRSDRFSQDQLRDYVVE